MLKLSGAVAAAALIITTFGATPAKADIELTISDGTSTYTFTGTTAAIAIPTDTISLNNLLISTASGVSSTNPSSLNLSSIDVKSGNASGTVTITLSADGFTSPTGPGFLAEALSASSIEHGSVSVSYYEGQNLGDKTSPTSGNTLTLTNNSNTLEGLATTGTTGLVDFTSPFALTEVATINLQGNGTAILNFGGILMADAAVPEPASMVLFGTVLAGVAFTMRKRFVRG